MNFNQYQIEVKKLCVYPKGSMYPILGISEEAGEIAGKFAKALRANTEVNAKAVALEFGDLLFMIAAAAHDLGYDLETIALLNIDKLHNRKVRGVIVGEGDNR